MSASAKIRENEKQSVDWQFVHRELRHPKTTLKTLWPNYQAQCSYEQFCRQYRRWRNTLNILVRRIHKAGAEIFVTDLEYPDLPFRILDSETGEVHPASLFVAALPASNYCFAEVFAEKNIVNWIAFHTHAFQFFGGAARTLVAETENCVLSTHAFFKNILRLYKIKIAYGEKRQVSTLLLRWFRTALRGKTFLSVAEANAAILNLLNNFNARKFKKVAGSPYEWFESIERAALTGCPTRINTKALAKMSTHPQTENQDRTIAPSWSPNRVCRWASTVGPATSHVVACILRHAQNSRRGVCSCLGILSLEKDYGSERLEAACKLAALQTNWTVSCIRHMLKEGLDQSFIQLTIPQLIVPATNLKPRKQRKS